MGIYVVCNVVIMIFVSFYSKLCGDCLYIIFMRYVERFFFMMFDKRIGINNIKVFLKNLFLCLYRNVLFRIDR